MQAVVTVIGAPLMPEPAAEKGFKIERKYYTLAGKPADPTKVKQNERFAVVLKITEPQPQFGRIIVADYLPAGFEIDNPRLVSSGDTGTLPGSRTRQEPVNAEFRDDRFSAAFDAQGGRRGGVHRRLCGARGVARPLRASAGLSWRTCIVPTASAAPPPARSRSRRRSERSGAEPPGSSPRPPPSPQDAERERTAFAALAALERHRGVVAIVASSFDGWVLDRLARPAAARRGARLLHPRGRSRGTAAAALHHAGGPLAAAGDARATSIRASSSCCSPTRTSASAPITASIRWRSAARSRSSQQRPHRLRRRRRSRMQVARLLEPRTERSFAAKLRQIVRAIEIERTLSKDEILALYLEPRALWRQPRRRARRLARLFRQGAAAADARRGGAAGRAAAIAGSAPARPLRRRRARARDRVLDRVAAAGGVPPDEVARAKPRPVPDGAPADADAGAACGGRGGRGRARPRASIA